MDYFSKLYPFSAIIPVLALEQDGLERVIKEIIKLFPYGPFFYDPEYVTDLPLKLLIAEIIREKVIMNTYQEILYATAVRVKAIEEVPEKNLLHIQATIFVEDPLKRASLLAREGACLKRLAPLHEKSLSFCLKGVFNLSSG